MSQSGNSGEKIAASAIALATQAAQNEASPEHALSALLIASCWVAKGCAVPGVDDPKILELMKNALDILAPGAFADLEKWQSHQAQVAASKGPTDV